MKKYALLYFLLLLAKLSSAQKLKEDKTIKDKREFNLNVGFGGGVWTYAFPNINGEISLQSELRPINAFSAYITLAYGKAYFWDYTPRRNFSFNWGIRIFPLKDFFAGLGAGYIYFSDDGKSKPEFAFSPHIGFADEDGIIYGGYTHTTLMQEPVGNIYLVIAPKLFRKKVSQPNEKKPVF
jgi:hypothetical protein